MSLSPAAKPVLELTPPKLVCCWVTAFWVEMALLTAELIWGCRAVMIRVIRSDSLSADEAVLVKELPEFLELELELLEPPKDELELELPNDEEEPTLAAELLLLLEAALLLLRMETAPSCLSKVWV